MTKEKNVKNFIELNKDVSRNVKKRGRAEISDFEYTKCQNRVQTLDKENKNPADFH